VARVSLIHDADVGWFSCFLGGSCRFTLHSDQFLGRLSQIEVLAEQGDRSATMLHYGASLLVNVVAGSMQLRLGSECQESLGQGGTIFLPSGTAHRWDCAEGQARVLLTYAPGGIESVLQACADRSREDQIAAAHSFGIELRFDWTEQRIYPAHGGRRLYNVRMKQSLWPCKRIRNLAGLARRDERKRRRI
jgi:hypothetical protein